MSRRVAVTVSHLELPSPAALRPSTAKPDGVVLRRETAPDAARVAATMYRRVGGRWHWRDRLPWSAADWEHEVHRDAIEVWTLTEGDLAIGYFELEVKPEVAEVKYFGLTEEGMGRGLGGWLLTRAIERSWEAGATRVILNTCTLDGPAALPNYLARGFRLVRVEHQEREIPE